MAVKERIQIYLGIPLKEVWERVFATQRCPICFSTRYRFVRYNEQHPEHTDDTWHEFQCLDCPQRIGRWSGAPLGEHKIEIKGYQPTRAVRRDNGKIFLRALMKTEYDPTVGTLPSTPA